MNTLRKLFLIFVSFMCALSLYSCQESKDTNKKEVSYLEKNAKTFSRSIDLKNISRVSLSPEAQNACSDWIAYLTAKSEVGKIPGFSLQDLISNSDNLVQTFDQLQDTVPKKFDVVPVKSRITVLRTKAHVLQQNASRKKIDPDAIAQSGRAIYKAFSNLKIQLNEVFLEHLRDFDFDMDKAQDSIQKAKKNKPTFQGKVYPKKKQNPKDTIKSSP